MPAYHAQPEPGTHSADPEAWSIKRTPCTTSGILVPCLRIRDCRHAGACFATGWVRTGCC
jgi:hypothetical protein